MVRLNAGVTPDACIRDPRNNKDINSKQGSEHRLRLANYRDFRYFEVQDRFLSETIQIHEGNIDPLKIMHKLCSAQYPMYSEDYKMIQILHIIYTEPKY